MKLHDLIYYAHGWSLAIHGRPLIKDDVEAWNFGRVNPSVFGKFKEFGVNSIEQFAKGFDGSSVYEPRVRYDDGPAITLLNEIWRAYGSFTTPSFRICAMRREPRGVVHGSKGRANHTR